MMTAKELIERLRGLDPETIIHIRKNGDVVGVTGFELEPATTYTVSIKRSMTILNRLVIC